MIVGLGNSFDHLLAISFRLVEQVGRNLFIVIFGAQSFVAPNAGAHLHQIDHALELVLGSDGNLNCDRPAFQAVHNGIDSVVEIGSHAIHFVDETNAWHSVLVGLTPHGFRLRLYTGYCIEYRHSAVQNAQAALHFGREIHVARRVDDVNRIIAPLAGGGSGGDGDSTLLLLLHPIHNGRAFMHFADLVGPARVVQHTFRSGGFTGIDVGHDADVSHPFDRYGSHKS